MPDRSQGTNTETQPLFDARYSNNHTSVPTLRTATSEHQDLGVHPLGAIDSSVAMNAVGSHPGTVQDATAGSGAQNPTPPGHSVQSTVQRPRLRFGVLPPGSASAYSEVLERAVFVVVSCSSTKNGYHFRGDLAPGSKFQGVEGSKLFGAHQAAFDSVIADPANATRIGSICSYGSLRGLPNSATIPSSRFNKRNGTLQTPEVSAACDLALVMRRMINESEIPQPENGYQVITAQPPFYQSLQYPRGNPLGEGRQGDMNTVGTELLSPDHMLKYDTIHEDMVRVLSLTPDEWLAAHWDYGTQSTVLKGVELSRTADQKARVQRTLEKYGAGRETGRKTGRRFSPLPPSTGATFNAASQVYPTMAQSTQEHAQHLQIPTATAWGLHCHPSNLHSLSQPFGLSQHPQYPMSGTQGWPGSPAPQTYSQGPQACYSGLQDFSANIDPYGELHLSQAWSHHGVHRYLEVPNATTPTLSLNLSNLYPCMHIHPLRIPRLKTAKRTPSPTWTSNHVTAFTGDNLIAWQSLNVLLAL
jgi:hypothetical protein